MELYTYVVIDVLGSHSYKINPIFSPSPTVFVLKSRSFSTISAIIRKPALNP